MSDSKYFEITDAEGVISISHEVVASVAAMACQEVNGVAAMAAVPDSAQKGVVITLDEADGSCAIDVHIMVKMGAVLAQVAEAVQEAVKAAVETGTGIEPRAVNVFVAGVSTK